MKKKIYELTDSELLEVYKTAVNWMSKKMQVIGTDKNEAGEKYNHREFEIGLSRIEKIESELMRRGLDYG